MSSLTYPTLAAVVLLAGLGVARAPTAQQHEVHHPRNNIAFLKTNIGIIGSQLPQWDFFADTLHNSAKSSATMRPAMGAMHYEMPATLPAKMTAHLDSLKTSATATKSLYAVLTAPQKKTAVELILSPMGGV